MNSDSSLVLLHALKAPDLIRPLALGAGSCPQPRQDPLNALQSPSPAFIPSIQTSLARSVALAIKAQKPPARAEKIANR